MSKFLPGDCVRECFVDPKRSRTALVLWVRGDHAGEVLAVVQDQIQSINPPLWEIVHHGSAADVERANALGVALDVESALG